MCKASPAQQLHLTGSQPEQEKKMVLLHQLRQSYDMVLKTGVGYIMPALLDASTSSQPHSGSS